MGNSYTELFFLDEVSALAAGHRPCFECRRKEANAFASAWIKIYGRPDGSLADAMDKLLHTERIQQHKPISAVQLKQLPDGSMLKANGFCFAKKGEKFLKWSGSGYKNAELPTGEINLLTPRSTIEALLNGYQPQWHRSA
jgi:hypothetical protein